MGPPPEEVPKKVAVIHCDILVQTELLDVVIINFFFMVYMYSTVPPGEPSSGLLDGYLLSRSLNSINLIRNSQSQRAKL